MAALAGSVSVQVVSRVAKRFFRVAHKPVYHYSPQVTLGALREPQRQAQSACFAVDVQDARTDCLPLSHHIARV